MTCVFGVAVGGGHNFLIGQENNSILINLFETFTLFRYLLISLKSPGIYFLNQGFSFFFSLARLIGIMEKISGINRLLNH